MASIDYTANIATSGEGFFTRLISRVAKGMEARANARGQQIAFLNSLSDAELAARGLRRENIVQYVFRDIWYI